MVYSKRCPVCDSYQTNMTNHKKSIGHRSMLSALKKYIKDPNAPGRGEVIRNIELSREI